MNQKFVKVFSRVIAFVLAVILIVSAFMVIPFAGEVGAAAGYVVYGAEAGSAEDKLDSTDLNRLGSYMEYIHKNFKDVIDYDTLIDGAFDGVTKALDDRFSTYFPSQEEADNFTSSVDGSFEGIGVSISMGSDGKCVVNEPIAGGPALAAGIKAGDIITAIDGKSVDGLSLNEISAKLRGEKGTQVKVTVQRDGSSISYDITRDTVKEQCLSYEMLEGNIGYIKMTGFDSDANTEFKMAAISLTNKGAEKIILDLRGNPGGYVDQALNIADSILEKGYISHFQSRGKIIESYSAKAIDKVYQPIVLLVDKDTASSSEILAAALKDNDAATIVGTTTYGKGIAQQMVSIGDGKSAKLSTFYFLTPDKNMIHEVGITPDVVVENITASELIAAQEKYSGFAPMTEKEKPTIGTVGLNVFGAQQRLELLGYNVTATGTMDANTADAVKAFQKSEGLYPYAVLDYTTMSRLDSAAAAYVSGQTATDNQLAKAIEIAKSL